LHDIAHEIFVLGSFVAAISVQVDHLPTDGESVRASSFLIEAGGKGLNIAAGLRRLGWDVNGLFGVGDDIFAEVARAAFKRARLRNEMILSLGGLSGSGIGLIDKSGENIIAVFPGANDRLAAHHVLISGAAIERSRLVVAQFEIMDEPIMAGFGIARRRNIPTILSPSPFRSVLPEILAMTTVLIVNENEALSLAADLGVAIDRPALRAWGAFDGLAVVLLDSGVSTLVVTLGSDGAAVWNRSDRPIHLPAFDVAAIDATGAGDAFLAGFAAGLGRGLTLSECLAQGNACGALTASHVGVLDHLPTFEQVTEMVFGETRE